MSNSSTLGETIPESVRVHKLGNGLTLIMERMPHLRSAAFTIMVPAGTANEPADRQGLAAIVIEMMQRGAGSRSSRAIVEDLDFLGVERDSHVSTQHSSFSAAMIDEYLFDALAIYAEILKSPHFPEDQLDDSRLTALQELSALEDDAVQRCLIRLRRLRYGDVFGRNSSGTAEGVQGVTLEDVKRYYANEIHAHGSILSIAGNIDYQNTIDAVETLLSDWNSGNPRDIAEIPVSDGYDHIDEETSQTQIALAYDAVPYDHERYYESRALINILGDGMSSRLFTEVREKRGLVYTVSAAPQSIGTRSSTIIYAGTTTARAGETLSVILATIHSLADGISDDELRRLKARVKTSLVFEQESCTSRSSQNATDWYYLHRIVDRREVSAKVDRLTIDTLKQHATEYQPRNKTLVTLGERRLENEYAV